MDIALLVALALHTIAFVIAWGYYGILGRIILPGLATSLTPADQARTLAAIESRARPLVLLSVVLFVASGTYLLLADASYRGLGNFGSAWAALMLVKHLLIIGLIALGVVVDFLVRGLRDLADERDVLRDVRLVRYSAEGATALGAVIVVLTAAAQLSAN